MSEAMKPTPPAPGACLRCGMPKERHFQERRCRNPNWKKVKGEPQFLSTNFTDTPPKELRTKAVRLREWREKQRALGNRWVYGAKCFWFGPIEETKRIGTTKKNKGIPCCPHCAGDLYQMRSATAWWEYVRNHDKKKPGYLNLMEWVRASGIHFQSYALALAAFNDHNSQKESK